MIRTRTFRKTTSHRTRVSARVPDSVQRESEDHDMYGRIDSANPVEQALLAATVR
jgi:hypothetical protein